MVSQPAREAAVRPGVRAARLPRPPRNFGEVPGWFSDTDALLFELLLDGGAVPAATGDLLEIGVYQGKSAIHMGRFLREGEAFTVCDLFDLAKDDAATASVRAFYQDLTQAVFERNYLLFHPTLPTIVRGPSQIITDHVAPGSCRFVHVDGSHRYEHVRADALAARTLMRDDGVVVFDDYRTAHTPGTAAAVWEAVVTQHLNVICVTDTKLYGTWGEAEPVQERIVALVAGRGGYRTAVQPVMGAPLLRVWPRRQAATAQDRGWRRVAVDVLPPVATRALRRWRRSARNRRTPSTG